jgi:WD40-like Beta Propeller Repeat
MRIGRALVVVATGSIVLAAPGPSPRERSATVAELFAPGVISTRDYERDGAFSPDGKTFYFTKRTMWSYFSAICVSHWRDGRWSEPEVASFSGQYADLTPFVTADGAHLYFASRRPNGDTTVTGYSIWMVDRDAGGWSAPRRLPAPINDRGSVINPVVTRDGSIYVLRGDVPHAFVARPERKGWAEPVMAGDDNVAGSYETGFYVDPDEQFMIVAAIGRSDALMTAEGIYARADLYVRDRVGSGWSTLRHLEAPINSPADEGAPIVSPDRRFLYFMSERGAFTEHGPIYAYDRLERDLRAPGNGLGDFYRVPFERAGVLR